MHTRTVLAEVLCLTLCGRCANDGRLPAILLSTAVKFVEQHRTHLARTGLEERHVVGRVHAFNAVLAD